MPKTFAHDMLADVIIKASGETGIVIARMDHLDSSDQYLVRFKDGTGCARETWWADSALEPLEPHH